jgi:hypothetical protein
MKQIDRRYSQNTVDVTVTWSGYTVPDTPFEANKAPDKEYITTSKPATIWTDLSLEPAAACHENMCREGGSLYNNAYEDFESIDDRRQQMGSPALETTYITNTALPRKTHAMGLLLLLLLLLLL